MIRPIDANALITEYDRVHIGEPGKARQLILDAPTIEPGPQWIPVSERLPEDGNWCLFTDGASMSVERHKADALDHFFPEGRWFRLEDAVAWMPLPEPYEEGK